MSQQAHIKAYENKEISAIIIHCTYTPNGREHSASDIHRWHAVDNGWHGIGYHYLIKIDGTVEKGRPEYWRGSHVGGHNTGTLGIVLVGDDEFSDKQWVSLGWLVRQLKAKYPSADVRGHRDYDSSKTCPNFDASQWWENYQKEVEEDEKR